MDATTIRRAVTFRSVDQRVVLVAAIGSAVLILAAWIDGWPAWRAALPILLVWLPIVTVETSWMKRRFGWLALFYGLVVWQGGHVIEHLAQMVQIHALGATGPAARGIFGKLDVEWVHFGFNTAILLAVAALLVRFRRNPWLWVAAIAAGWHQAEHVLIMVEYLRTGVPGDPGLLSRGGVLFGGVSLARPDLHFLYNVIETLPLVGGFLWQVGRSHDAWLATAFPTLDDETLATLTALAEPHRYEPGVTIVREGEFADRFCVVTEGTVVVSRAGPVGEMWVATLGPGQFFGEIALLEGVPRTATVRSRERIELLELDRVAFDSALEAAPPLRSILTDVAVQRTASFGVTA